MKRMSAFFKKMVPEARALTDHPRDRAVGISGESDNRAFVHQDDFVADNFLQDVGDNDLFFLGEETAGLSDKRFDELLQERQPLCQLAREDRDVVVCVLTPVLIEKGYRPVVAEGWVAQLLQEHNSLTVAELATVIDQFDELEHGALAPGELSIEEMTEDVVVLPEPTVVLADTLRNKAICSLHQRTLAVISPLCRLHRAPDGARTLPSTRSIKLGERVIVCIESSLLLQQQCAELESVLPPDLLNRVADRISDQE
ncbi:hypothetical protein [Kistimonas asteriae]|uniref:hypothetical protein n=1 Tax=Kistimonas asteriae TaxID=517724 RepID=UPI001BACCFFD|nr:hypothetical protein [Kistimonas asteriae]